MYNKCFCLGGIYRAIYIEPWWHNSSHLTQCLGFIKFSLIWEVGRPFQDLWPLSGHLISHFLLNPSSCKRWAFNGKHQQRKRSILLPWSRFINNHAKSAAFLLKKINKTDAIKRERKKKIFFLLCREQEPALFMAWLTCVIFFLLKKKKFFFFLDLTDSLLLTGAGSLVYLVGGLSTTSLSFSVPADFFSI